MRMVGRVIKWVITPLPSLFDFLLWFLMFFIAYWHIHYEKLIAFNFGVILLLCSTTVLKEKRDFKCLPMFLLLCWGFIEVFLQSYIIPKESVVLKYLNIYLLSEGFIYIFSGLMLIYLITRYASNLRLNILILPFLLIPMVLSARKGGRMTIIFALCLSVIIYLILNRKYLIALIPVIFGTGILIWKWQWMCMKFIVRPWVWRELWIQVTEHPWIGKGFAHNLGPNDMVWCRKIGDVEYGWVYRHNDYLSFGTYYGVIAIVLVVWLVLKVLKDIKYHPASIVFMTFCIVPIFQGTMQDIYRASITVFMIGISMAVAYDNKISKIRV